MADSIFETLKPDFKGEIDFLPETLEKYSHDASLFEIKPRVVVFPKDADDIKILVKWVNENKEKDKTLSITARAAGTDMSGGSIGSSIIVDFTKHLNKIISVLPEEATCQPGVFYRDFDKETKKIDRYMPAFTASREINAMGGMVGNNSGGEKAIKFGKTENYINQLKVVLSDGNEYVFRPLTKDELEQKLKEDNLQSEIYKKIWKIINDNYDVIMSAKPDVSKNSAGYYLWNVYDRNTGKFDICRLIVGSQGTLGIVTEITFRLVPTKKFSNILVVFLPSLEHVTELITEVLPFKPDGLETFDDKSLILAVRFFSDFIKQMGFFGALRLGLEFIPEDFMVLTGGVPKMILLIQFDGQTEEEVKTRLEEIYKHIQKFGYKMHIAKSSDEAEKYWRIRHESFNLMRKHTKGKRTAPFIDDFVVKPQYLPKFLPEVQALIDQYKLDYTVQGHLGNGNFHIIPLMDLNSPLSADIILELSQKVYDIVLKYHGSITAEHNDGIIRTPYLLQQFGPKIIELFKETKEAFDPKYIFNPGKKVGGTFEDIRVAVKKKNS
jgi:FAD/FMN-containing dehydrogenase